MDVSTIFRIVHPDLVPAEVTELLRLSPDIAHRRGETEKKGQSTVVFSDGVWGLRAAEADGGPLESQVKGLLTRLEGREVVLRQLAWRGYRIEFFVGVFGIDGNLGLELSSATIGKIGELGADLDLDLYSA